MTRKDANLKKKWLTCLKCGERIWTDRCHRFCRRCRIAIQRYNSRIPSRYTIESSDSKHSVVDDSMDST